MNHALSTHLFVTHRLTGAMLARIQQSGIGAVEVFCARQHLDYRNKAQITELGHWFRDSELKLHSLHSPMYTDEIWGRSGPHSVLTITELVKARRLEMVDEIKRAIEIAEVIPFRYMRAASTSEAVAAASCDGDAKFVAGGTNLIDLLKNDVERPTTLVDVSRILPRAIELRADGGLRVGAGVAEAVLGGGEDVRKWQLGAGADG